MALLDLVSSPSQTFSGGTNADVLQGRAAVGGGVGGAGGGMNAGQGVDIAAFGVDVEMGEIANSSKEHVQFNSAEHERSAVFAEFTAACRTR